ncbi:PAS domain S-box protein [Deinococcus planocerae]|uniref:PAS domain S-box protein n=1 Tax=Deinococcus planocerae TaxID=1737569 RepID=UPI0015E0EB16|nr:PAS domain S-box protein [Deinococcus planocerae]
MAGAGTHEPDSLFRQLLDGLPDPVLALDPGGRAVYVNPPAARLLGYGRSVLPERPVWEAFPAVLGPGFETLIRRALRERADLLDEEYAPGPGAWLEVRVSPSPSGLLVICRDVTSRRQAEAHAADLGALTLALSEAVEEAEVARALARHVPAALGADLAVLALLTAKNTEFRLLRSPEGPDEGPQEDTWPLEAGSPLADLIREGAVLPGQDVEWSPVAEFVRTLAPGRPVPGGLTALPLSAGGHALGALFLGFPAGRALPAEKRSLLLSVAGQCALALERARLLGAERRARQRLEALAAAGLVLASSLDERTTLGNVARVVVEHLADWVMVDLLDEQGRLRRVAAAHHDPEKDPLAQRLLRWQPQPEVPNPVTEVLRTGQPRLIDHVPDELVVRGKYDDEHLELVRSLTPRALMVVPLTVQTRVIGALTLVRAWPGAHYGEEDLTFAAELARRAAVAVDQAQTHARLARREGQLRRIAEANIIGILRVVEGEIVEANDAFLDMLGYTREDLRAGRLRWRDLTPPELHPPSEQAEEDVRRTGVVRPFEKEYLARDGRRVPVLVGAARLDEEEGPGHMTFVLDLSELASLKRAQAEREALLEQQAAERARYEAVLQQQPVGALVVDAGSGRVQFANRRFEELLGVEVQPGVAAQAVLRHLLDSEGRPLDGHSLLDEALRRGRATVDQDLRVVREGGQRPVWASAAPVRNRLGVILYAVLTLDETEERWERLLPALAGQQAPEEASQGPVTPEIFVRVVGRQLASLGHAPLEGRLVALLLLSAGGLTLTGAAERLHATKGALSRVMNELLARGDVVVTREPSSREYHLELSNGTYLRDLLEKRALSLSIASLGYALLRDQPDLDAVVARRVREMADIRTRNALHLSRLLEARRSAQRQARQTHLEGNWDAVPPRDER